MYICIYIHTRLYIYTPACDQLIARILQEKMANNITYR